MFDVRLRLYSPSGVKQRVLKTLTIEWAGPESASPSVRFAVSSRVAGYLTAPIVVGVEYSSDGGAWKSPRNDLFIAEEEDADSADSTQTVNFSGTGLVSWLLSRNLLHWTPSAKNGERDWVQFPSGDTGSATPGHMLNGMLVEAKNRGWGPNVSWDFTGLKDSLGANWSLAGDDLWWEPWKLLTPVSKVLEQVAQGGFCEWWSEGLKLRMSRPGAGVDRSESVVLGGAGFSRAPGKASFNEVFTHLTVVPEKARHWLYLTNAGADASFGRLEATMTQSGVKDHARATKLAQPVLTNGRNLQRQQSFEWVPSSLTRNPFDHFNVGDEVTVRTRNGKDKQRVIGLVVSKDASAQVKVRVVTGHKLLGRTTKLLNRVGQATMGGVIGGTGSAFPAAQRPPSDQPATPMNVSVTGNTAVWAEDGSGVATITLGWDAVTQTTEGNVIDVAEYEVWGRKPAEPEKHRVTASLNPTVSFQMPSGESGVWAVRARSAAGVWSEFSAEVAGVAASPASIVPKPPTGLAVVSNVGEFRKDGTSVARVQVSWTPVTESTDSVPVSIAEYEVAVGLDVQRVRGASASFTLPTGKSADVRVRALSTLRVWGDPSAALAVTGAEPALLNVAPSAPIITVGMGGIAYRYDGLTSTGAVMPAGFARIVVDTGTTATGPWVSEGVTLSAAGGGTVVAAVGSAVFVRFRAFDTLGRLMGTSVVKSGTAAGIALGDIPGLEADLDGIRFTADGKNRVYVQTDSPGENLFTNGSFEEAAGTVEVPWDAMRPLRAFTRSGVSAAQGYVSDTAIDVQPGQTIRACVDWSSTDPTDSALFGLGAYKDGVWDSAGSGTSAWGDSMSRWIGPVYSTDRARRVKHFVVPEGVTKVQFSHYKNAGAGLYTYTLSVHVVGDPDLDVTYATSPPQVGAPTNGESVLTGAKVAGIATSGCAAIRSTKWKRTGAYSMRLIPTRNTTSVNYAILTIPAAAANGGTVAATFRQEAEIAAPLWAQRGRPYTVAPMTQPGQAPNAPGETGLRWSWDVSLTSASLVLPHGGVTGSGDVWWDDIAIFAGNLETPFVPGDLWLQLAADGASVVAVKVWNGASWAPQVLYADSILAAESITSPLIRAGAIQFVHASPTFGQELDITANEAVNIIVGDLEAQSGELAKVDQAVAGAQKTAEDANKAAGTAQSTANAANTTAQSAASAAGTVGQRLDKHQTYYRFGADGLSIGDPNQPQELRLKPGRAEMAQNGVVVSYWEGGVFVAYEARLDSAQIGNHQFMAYGAGRTIVRPL